MPYELCADMLFVYTKFGIGVGDVAEPPYSHTIVESVVAIVLWAIVIESGPSPSWKGREPEPHVALVRSSNTLCRIVMWFVRWLDETLSVPRMLTPPAVCLTRLYWNVTRCTTTHGAVPL